MFFGSTSWEDLGNFRREEGDWGNSGGFGGSGCIEGGDLWEHGTTGCGRNLYRRKKNREVHGMVSNISMNGGLLGCKESTG